MLMFLVTPNFKIWTLSVIDEKYDFKGAYNATSNGCRTCIVGGGKQNNSIPVSRAISMVFELTWDSCPSRFSILFPLRCCVNGWKWSRNHTLKSSVSMCFDFDCWSCLRVACLFLSIVSRCADVSTVSEEGVSV